MKVLQRLLYPLAKLERFIYPLAILVGAIAIVSWYWTTTPAYALNEIAQSLRKHDVQLFDKYVDVDAIAAHAFDDLIDGPAREELVGRFSNVVGLGFLRFFKKDIVGIAHERLRGLIADPSISFAQLNSASPETLSRYKLSPRVRQTLFDYGLSSYGYKGIKYLKVDGAKARVGLQFFSPRLNQFYMVEFQLEDVGGYWRVDELTNLGDLVTLYLDTRLDRHQQE